MFLFLVTASGPRAQNPHHWGGLRYRLRWPYSQSSSHHPDRDMLSRWSGQVCPSALVSQSWSQFRAILSYLYAHVEENDEDRVSPCLNLQMMAGPDKSRTSLAEPDRCHVQEESPRSVEELWSSAHNLGINRLVSSLAINIQ